MEGGRKSDQSDFTPTVAAFNKGINTVVMSLPLDSNKVLLRARARKWKTIDDIDIHLLQILLPL